MWTIFMCVVLLEFLALLLLSCELGKDRSLVRFDLGHWPGENLLKLTNDKNLVRFYLDHRLGENLLKLAKDRNLVQFNPGY